MIVKVQDLSDPNLDIYSKYNESQLLHLNEPNEGVFIAESPKVIERALDAGYEPISMLVDQRHIEGEAKNVIGRLDTVPVYAASHDVLKGITGSELTRGALCAFKRKRLPSPSQLIGQITFAGRIVVLENVVNPTNVGAIIRNAAALGWDAVLLTKGSSDPFYRRALRVSMGTALQIPWTYINGNSYVDELHMLGFKTVAMALKKDSLNIDSDILKQEKKLAVILGTEGNGMAELNIKNSDYTVCIPMAHGVDSLNVSCASAVALWELSK